MVHIVSCVHCVNVVYASKVYGNILVSTSHLKPVVCVLTHQSFSTNTQNYRHLKCWSYICTL
jgi:hypothetical protein